MKAVDMTGMTFGYWEVLSKDAPHHNAHNSYWVCRCKCGNIRTLTRSSLVSGRSVSCGCKPSERRKGINKTHGMSKTRLYNEWASMRKRCKSPTGKCANSYCLKGVTVCEQWEKFEPFRDWALSNGYSDTMTIDRIDNSKGYCPSNCRWITNAEQQANKTNNVIIEYNGEKWCLRTLCAKLGFPYKTAHKRYMRALRRGDEINSGYLFAPIDAKKIAYKYRHHDLPPFAQ